MKPYQKIANVSSKEDLANFVSALLDNLKSNPDEWENPTLERFLEAMAGWIAEMDAYYKNTGHTPPATPTWRTFAEILYAARIYE